MQKEINIGTRHPSFILCLELDNENKRYIMCCAVVWLVNGFKADSTRLLIHDHQYTKCNK
jgi:hypothetical protein